MGWLGVAHAILSLVFGVKVRARPSRLSGQMHYGSALVVMLTHVTFCASLNRLLFHLTHRWPGLRGHPNDVCHYT